MLLTKEPESASHGLGDAFQRGGGPAGEDRGGAFQGRFAGEGGSHVGDEEFARALGAGGGVLGREVDLAFAFAMPVDVGLAQEHVGAAREFGQCLAGSAVPGVPQDTPLALGAQPVRLGVVGDGACGEPEVPVPDGVAVVERSEVEDAVQEADVRLSEEAA